MRRMLITLLTTPKAYESRIDDFGRFTVGCSTAFMSFTMIAAWRRQSVGQVEERDLPYSGSATQPSDDLGLPGTDGHEFGRVFLMGGFARAGRRGIADPRCAVHVVRHG